MDNLKIVYKDKRDFTNWFILIKLFFLLHLPMHRQTKEESNNAKHTTFEFK